MGDVIVRKEACQDGVLYRLDWYYKGTRHRPQLGKNLTNDQAHELALVEVARIRSSGGSPKKALDGCTLSQFIPTYWENFAAKKRVDDKRPNGVINTHLKPYHHMRLTEVNDPRIGKDYIVSRLKLVTPGTVAREWNIFMRIINLAVRLEFLERNKLAGVRGDWLPEANKRERMIERWEVEALRDKGGNEDIWWAFVAAMHTGLRESKLLSALPESIQRDAYGTVLHLGAARTRIKGNLPVLPINAWAVKAISRRFPWKTIRTFRYAWDNACAKAGLVDIHFHDARHLFATTLEDLEVDTRHIKLLLGHSLTDITDRYIRQNMRLMHVAVKKLEQAYDPSNLGVGQNSYLPVGQSAEQSGKQVTLSTITQVIEIAQ